MIPRIPASQSEYDAKASAIVATARAVLRSPDNIVPLPVIGAAMVLLQRETILRERQHRDA
jgi:hypothetical protein